LVDVDLAHPKLTNVHVMSILPNQTVEWEEKMRVNWQKNGSQNEDKHGQSWNTLDKFPFNSPTTLSILLSPCPPLN